jgi:SAM-dependent methyltransferase
MQGYRPETYGDRWADVYDTWIERRHPDMAAQPAVDCLTDLAAGGRVLELAIGTGRIGLPLAQRGLEVHGVDASEAMVAKLREKPGGDEIPVTVGDFADVGVDGTFDLIFVVFNTLFALTAQEEQIRCFANVARHLTATGVFVIEVFVPDVARFDGGQSLRVTQVMTDEVHLDVSLHDPVAQNVMAQNVAITRASTQLRPVHLRYAWPSELDLMARLAGLELRDRWAGWDRAPFTASSGAHVSVYARST